MNVSAQTVEALFREKRSFFLKVLSRRLKDPEVAEQILQDAFIQFMAAAARQPIDNPDGYLMRIAINLSTDWLRQDRSRNRRERTWVDSNYLIGRSGEAEAGAAPADQALSAKEELAAVQRAIGLLSPPLRTAFTLHKLEGLSHAETAARMGLSTSTIEKHIMKAMKHLLETLPRHTAH